jgi:ribosome-binding protein aMBF1 (putative translation factor)
MTNEDEILKKRFGQRLEAKRKAKGLSRPQLSHIIEMNVNWISRIEKGTGNPTMTVVVKLARALDCQPGDLLNDL